MLREYVWYAFENSIEFALHPAQKAFVVEQIEGPDGCAGVLDHGGNELDLLRANSDFA